MDVSSVKQPAGREKLSLGLRSVRRGKEPRGLNSTGPPRASQMATPKREPRRREGGDGVDMGVFFSPLGFGLFLGMGAMSLEWDGLHR